MVRQAWNEGEYLMHLPAKGRSHLSTVLHMHRPFILVGALVLAACAAEPPAIETGPAADVAAAGTAETAAPASAVESTESSDGELVEALPVENVVANDTAVQPVVEAPNPVVCRLERRTGTNRKVKVCRRPATALAEEEMRRTFDSLRRSQMTVPE